MDTVVGDTSGLDEWTDGRHLRRDRNREAVVEAMLSLYAAGHLAPTAVEIAEAAGLSPRSLFRYFDDVDDLCRAAMTCQIERVAEEFSLDIDAGAPFSARVAAVVDLRIGIFEAMGPAGIVARLRAPFQPILADQLAAGRTLLRRELRRVLRPELDALGDRARGTLAVIDVVCSFEAYQLLRTDQRFGRAAAREALIDAVTAQLRPRKGSR